jgi:hypothetical protein
VPSNLTITDFSDKKMWQMETNENGGTFFRVRNVTKKTDSDNWLLQGRYLQRFGYMLNKVHAYVGRSVI